MPGEVPETPKYIKGHMYLNYCGGKFISTQSGPAFVVINRSNEHRPSKLISNEIYLLHSLNDNDSCTYECIPATYRTRNNTY